MKYTCKIVYVIIPFILLLGGCAPANRINAVENELQGSSMKPLGRFAVTENGALELISSAVHFGFSFYGKQCWITTHIDDANGHNYLQYELDAVDQGRVRIEGNGNQPVLIKAASGGKHTVWVYKATEAHTGPIFVDKVSGKQILPLNIPDQPLIEFIGNSITCGAAADPSEVPCGTGVYHDQHNAYGAYGPRVARKLGLNYILSSVSGIGVYRNWNSDGPTMPELYTKTDFQSGSKRLWDFSINHPVIVSIALGTNDYSNGDGKKERRPFDSARFVDQYIGFVKTVKSKYPLAQIALLSSPMLNGDRRIILQNCITAVKDSIDRMYPKDRPVATFFFRPMQTRGCSGHPNLDDHAILSDELTPFFRQLLAL
ncbi:MAG: GDSL family lipase [Terrimonas sp.]|nr:GDSL family lipase [Terrimonas sp.]